MFLVLERENQLYYTKLLEKIASQIKIKIRAFKILSRKKKYLLNIVCGNSNKPHPAAIGPPLPQSSKNGAHQIEIGLGPGKVCECCSGNDCRFQY